MDLPPLVYAIANALAAIDASGSAFKHFAPGVGPYGEPQLVRAVAEQLRREPQYRNAATKKTPDLLIPGCWALEFKIARPFGDNGKEAENWSVNLLHPYPGNVSVIGDCLKLCGLQGPERRAVVVVGYEHDPPQIPLSRLFAAFEAVARTVLQIQLGHRIEEHRLALCHPVHQQLSVVAWEVLGHVA